MEPITPLLKPLVEGMRHKHIKKGQVILYQGDRIEDMLVVAKGIVKIHDIDELGNEKVLHLVTRPGIIPFAFFSGPNQPTQWFYTALTDCEVWVIPHMRILSELQANSTLAVYLMNWFSKEVHYIFTRLSSLGKTQARDKLIAALKFLAYSHATQLRSNWCRVSFPMTHQLLADMTGITRESATFAMKELQAQGFVRHPHPGILEIKVSKLPH